MYLGICHTLLGSSHEHLSGLLFLGFFDRLDNSHVCKCLREGAWFEVSVSFGALLLYQCQSRTHVFKLPLMRLSGQTIVRRPGNYPR